MMGMRRPLLLLLLTLAGCGEAQPTLYERHLAAAAAYDRENAKLTRLVAEPSIDKYAVCLTYFMLHGDLPNERELSLSKETVSTRRRFPGDHCLAYICNSLPNAIARREQFEKVEQLRSQANEAHATWIASTQRE
jgi:hypothetical protein